jgi:CheY-like chemotaxis protein
MTATAQVKQQLVVGRTVLLVDDNPAILRSVELGLRRRGFLVESASNGSDALAVLASPQTIDIMFSDVIMPGGMSGLELARSSRALRPDLAVLLTTGYAYDLLETLGAHKDEFDLVTKPYTITNLITLINALLPAQGD